MAKQNQSFDFVLLGVANKNYVFVCTIVLLRFCYVGIEPTFAKIHCTFLLNQNKTEVFYDNKSTLLFYRATILW
ncbi:hypothetical protein EON70_00385 [bacterium]|nr:MAG: hypothetical protein EON70_00385 [bacterium]